MMAGDVIQCMPCITEDLISDTPKTNKQKKPHLKPKQTTFHDSAFSDFRDLIALTRKAKVKSKTK